jgi:hypothetical protein
VPAVPVTATNALATASTDGPSPLLFVGIFLIGLGFVVRSRIGGIDAADER